MIYQFAPVMSSVVETSLKRFLHSLRSVGMTTSVNMYIVPFHLAIAITASLQINTKEIRKLQQIYRYKYAYNALQASGGLTGSEHGVVSQDTSGFQVQ